MRKYLPTKDTLIAWAIGTMGAAILIALDIAGILIIIKG